MAQTAEGKKTKKNMVIFQVIPWETFPLGGSSSQQTEGGSFRYCTYTYICQHAKYQLLIACIHNMRNNCLNYMESNQFYMVKLWQLTRWSSDELIKYSKQNLFVHGAYSMKTDWLQMIKDTEFLGFFPSYGISHQQQIFSMLVRLHLKLPPISSIFVRFIQNQTFLDISNAARIFDE